MADGTFLCLTNTIKPINHSTFLPAWKYILFSVQCILYFKEAIFIKKQHINKAMCCFFIIILFIFMQFSKHMTSKLLSETQ